MAILEKQLQKNILQLCKQQGIIAVKVDSTSTQGWPDLTVVLPNGVVLFVELKTETGQLSKLQEQIHRKLQTSNANIYTIRTVESFRQLIASHTTDK